MPDPQWTVSTYQGEDRYLVYKRGDTTLASVGRRQCAGGFDALVAAVRDAARIPELETRLRQLEDALLLVVAELPVEQTLLLRAEVPRLADFISHLHHSIEHEQAMVRRNVWADLLASPAPQGEGT